MPSSKPNKLYRNIFYSILYRSIISNYKDKWDIVHITVTWRDVYRRNLDWWPDLLPTYTLMTRDYSSQIAATQRLVSSVDYNLH
jgi:hypothetical protein